MKLFTSLVPIVHLVVTMLACSVHAMPATSGSAVSTTRGTLSAVTDNTAGLLASSRAVNVTSQLPGDDEYDAATLEEALQLLEENAGYVSSEALVCTEQASRSLLHHRKEDEEILSAKDITEAVLDARKVNWGKIGKIIGLCASCASCLTNNRYGQNCPKLCHDCKHCCPETV